MLTLRPELSNLDACEVRETPLTWRFTTGALAYLSLCIIVRRAQDPSDCGHRGLCSDQLLKVPRIKTATRRSRVFSFRTPLSVCIPSSVTAVAGSKSPVQKAPPNTSLWSFPSSIDIRHLAPWLLTGNAIGLMDYGKRNG